MKHQDQLQFDPITTAPYTIFKQFGSNTFFVNSSCILATKKIITTGKEYILIDNSTGTTGKVTNVILADCYYRKGIIHLIVRDIRTQIVSTLDHGIEFPERACNFVLIDADYFRDWMNIKAIEAYCDCDIDSKKIPNSETSHKSRYEDNLLDFDF